MSERKTIALAGAIILCMGLACGGKTRTKADDDAEKASATPPLASAASTSGTTNGPRPIFVQADELLKEYKSNEVRADGKYKGRRVVVVGGIGDIKKDVLDSPLGQRSASAALAS